MDRPWADSLANGVVNGVGPGEPYTQTGLFGQPLLNRGHDLHGQIYQAALRQHIQGMDEV